MNIVDLIEDRWYEYFLHNQRGRLLESALLAQGNQRISTLSAPWYVSDQPPKSPSQSRENAQLEVEVNPSPFT